MKGRRKGSEGKRREGCGRQVLVVVKEGRKEREGEERRGGIQSIGGDGRRGGVDVGEAVDGASS